MVESSNPYRPIRSQVLEVIEETPTIKTLKMRPDQPLLFQTGQFVELTVPGVGEAPFTPSSRPEVKDTVEVSVMRVGRVTERIHELKKGDTVGLRGPFGTGYPVDEFAGKEVLVVGGGCGFAPIRSLMYELFRRSGEFKGLFFRGGCRTATEFLYKKETDEWSRREDLDMVLTVDQGGNGWTGHVGLVTTILEDLKMDTSKGIAVVCGPPVMMKFATIKLLDLGFKKTNMYLSMEKNMSCGFGKCGHCRIGNYYTCKDGPVFRFDRISEFPNIWD